jgi:hypothetical protein
MFNNKQNFEQRLRLEHEQLLPQNKSKDEHVT